MARPTKQGKPDKTDAQRIKDIRAALKKVKKGDELGIDDHAAIWGVSNPRWVNKRKEMSGFPGWRKEGNKYLYPAKESLECMLGFLTGAQEQQAEKIRRRKELLGADMDEALDSGLSVQDLVRVNALAASLDSREREQGKYVKRSEVEMIAGLVFSSISAVLSDLAKRIDPHGRLPASTRQMIDMQGHEALLKLHKNLKELLSPDVSSESLGKADPKPRKPRARRKRS